MTDEEEERRAGLERLEKIVDIMLNAAEAAEGYRGTERIIISVCDDNTDNRFCSGMVGMSGYEEGKPFILLNDMRAAMTRAGESAGMLLRFMPMQRPSVN